MGLFDSIRRVVGGDDGSSASDDTAAQPDLVDTRALDASALRERAAGVAGEVAVLDFSLSSLAQFDDAIDEGYDEPLATADEAGAYATDTVRFGCYLGEVLVRVYDGEWTRDPDWGVTLSGPDGTTTVAVFDVAERSITTGAVFAAVTDRAAVEVGLDDSPGDDSDGVPDDESTAETPSDGDDSPAETPTPEAVDESADAPDPTATGDTLSETDSVDDAESLIEEAEPEAAGDATTGADSAPSTAAGPDESERVADGSASLFEADAESAAQEPTGSPSLFDDGPTGAGPTVEDAPSADDGRPVAGSDPGPDGCDDPAGAIDSDDPDTDPAADDLRETYAEAAEELVTFWTEYDLDYTPESLARLDALVSEEWDDERFDDAVFGSEDTFDDRVFTSVSTELGSYFGEVLVRDLDAEWSDEATTDGVVVQSADGPLAIPVFRVAGTSIQQQPVFARSYDSLLADLEPDG